MTNDPAFDRFVTDYARHRAAEGRALGPQDLLRLPYLTTGPLARQWTVRARTFEAFMRHAVAPLGARLGRTLTILDLGAGNGWLSYRVAREGHRAIALDIRDDTVDGLGAAEPYVQRSHGAIERVVASFADIPFADGSVDLAVFNASIHYALDLGQALREAARVVHPGGMLAILDSPFYASESDGLAMVAEKRAGAAAQFGANADALLALPFIEFLTRDGLAAADRTLLWRRRRVLYPLWYELRGLRAALNGRRRPSRFDLWVADRPSG